MQTARALRIRGRKHSLHRSHVRVRLDAERPQHVHKIVWPSLMSGSPKRNTRATRTDVDRQLLAALAAQRARRSDTVGIARARSGRNIRQPPVPASDRRASQGQRVAVPLCNLGCVGGGITLAAGGSGSKGLQQLRQHQQVLADLPPNRTVRRATTHTVGRRGKPE
jgi:hypothetical protein